MNETWQKVRASVVRYASAWLVLGCAIGFCPVWFGDWSRSSVQCWIGWTATAAVMAWLQRLSACLRRDGHEIHAVLVFLLMLPSFRILSCVAQSRDLIVTPLSGVIDSLFGGYGGLCGAGVMIVAAVFETLGRESGWTRLRWLGPEPGWTSQRDRAGLQGR